MGHVRNYSNRAMRWPGQEMQGFNVLHPSVGTASVSGRAAALNAACPSFWTEENIGHIARPVAASRHQLRLVARDRCARPDTTVDRGSLKDVRAQPGI